MRTNVTETAPSRADPDVATFALIHGAGDVGWYWHLVEAELRRRGHGSVAPDLPIEDDAAGLVAYAEVVTKAVADRPNIVVVGQSFGGYVAPIVANLIGARLIVLVAGMVPLPGESAEEMFAATGWRQAAPEDASTVEVFYHDVPPELARAAMARGRRQSETPGREPWPLPRWPDIPIRAIIGRNDRFFPPGWLRAVVRDRLGILPDELDSGHCPSLSQPLALAERLISFFEEKAS